MNLKSTKAYLMIKIPTLNLYETLEADLIGPEHTAVVVRLTRYPNGVNSQDHFPLAGDGHPD